MNLGDQFFTMLDNKVQQITLIEIKNRERLVEDDVDDENANDDDVIKVNGQLFVIEKTQWYYFHVNSRKNVVIGLSPDELFKTKEELLNSL